MFYEILAKTWLIDEEYLSGYGAVIKSMLSNDGNGLRLSEYRELRKEVEEKSRVAYVGDDLMLSDEPTIHGNTAIVHLNGVIVKRGELCMKGTEDVRRELAQVGIDESVDSVVLSVDSGGGTVDGTAELAEDIKEYKEKYDKPIIGYIDGQALSAAYFIISQCDEIYMSSPSALAGSIGTKVERRNNAEMLKRLGISIETITATNSVNKTKQFNDKEMLVELLDDVQEIFEAYVKSGRKDKLNESATVKNAKDEDIPEIFSGKIYTGKKAVEMGLADGIMPLGQVVSNIRKKDKNYQVGRLSDENENSTNMKLKEKFLALMQEFGIKLSDEQNAKIESAIGGFDGVSMESVESAIESAISTRLDAFAQEMQGKFSLNEDTQIAQAALTEKLQLAQSENATLKAEMETLKGKLDDTTKVVASLKGKQPFVQNQSHSKEVEGVEPSMHHFVGGFLEPPVVN